MVSDSFGKCSVLIVLEEWIEALNNYGVSKKKMNVICPSYECIHCGVQGIPIPHLDKT